MESDAAINSVVAGSRLGGSRTPFTRMSQFFAVGAKPPSLALPMKEHKKAKAKTKSELSKAIRECEPNAAGIDLGAEEIWVAVPADRDANAVRRFEAFTRDLAAIVQWLVGCGVRSVAMEATGVYWIPLYQLLEDAGLKVCLVNARHVKNVPGRKSDVRDCQWLQYLHSVGLLLGSFRPAQVICATRSIYRYRQNLISMAAEHIQHMQAVLEQMNIGSGTV